MWEKSKAKKLKKKSLRSSGFYFYLRDTLLFSLELALALDSGRKVSSPIVFNQREKENCPGAKSCLYSTRNVMNLKIHVTE